MSKMQSLVFALAAGAALAAALLSYWQLRLYIGVPLPESAGVALGYLYGFLGALACVGLHQLWGRR